MITFFQAAISASTSFAMVIGRAEMAASAMIRLLNLDSTSPDRSSRRRNLPVRVSENVLG